MQMEVRNIFLRIAVAKNPSDVHLSYSSIYQRNGGHLRTKTHQHHHTTWSCSLIGKKMWSLSVLT